MIIILRATMVAIVLGTILSFGFLMVDLALPNMPGHVIIQPRVDDPVHWQWVSPIWLRLIGYEIPVVAAVVTGIALIIRKLKRIE